MLTDVNGESPATYAYSAFGSTPSVIMVSRTELGASMCPSLRKRHLPQRTLNPNLGRLPDDPVLLVETIDASEGSALHLKFESAANDRRHGVWIATEGLLRVGELEADQLLLWSDTAPEEVDVVVLRTDGLVRMYNVWTPDAGPGYRSQSDYSGMRRQELEDGWIRYSCTDFGLPPMFDRLVVSVRPERLGSGA